MNNRVLFPYYSTLKYKIRVSKALIQIRIWHIVQRDSLFCDFGKKLELLSIL